MNGIFSCAQKKIRDRSLLKLTKTRESCAPHEHARGRRPATLARGSRGVPCTLYQCAGTRSRTGPAIPTVKRKLCGRKGPEVFQPRGGGVPRVTGSQHMEILLLALCKNGGGSLWMGSKRQIDLYLSNDQTRRHPQRKFRDFRVKTNCI